MAYGMSYSLDGLRRRACLMFSGNYDRIQDMCRTELTEAIQTGVLPDLPSSCPLGNGLEDIPEEEDVLKASNIQEEVASLLTLGCRPKEEVRRVVREEVIALQQEFLNWLLEKGELK